MDVGMAASMATMSSSTGTGMTMTIASPTASSMSMDHSGHSSSMPMQMGMSMTFFTSTSTPLFSQNWTPRNTGQYAGTCIFLIVLSFILRLLYAYKCRLEAAWHAKDTKRRYIYTQPPQRTSEEDEESDVESRLDVKTKGSEAVLTMNGVTERVKVVRGQSVSSAQPFRLSVDLVRAGLVTVMVGLGYLLMLAVMTMNVGYFMSVLGGAFLGELCFGRFSTHHVEDHH